MATFRRTWWGSKKPPPWEPGPSILSVLRDLGRQEAQRSPGEDTFMKGDIRLASDATRLFSKQRALEHGDPSVSELVQNVLEALKRIVKKDDDKRRIVLYRVALTVPVIHCADELSDALRRQHAVGAKDVRPHARWLVHIAAHREPLKLGILLLGLAGTKEDVADLQVIAKHADFAPFVATAMKNLLGR